MSFFGQCIGVVQLSYPLLIILSFENISLRMSTDIQVIDVWAMRGQRVESWLCVSDVIGQCIKIEGGR